MILLHAPEGRHRMGVNYGQQLQIHDPLGRRKYLTGSERERFLAAADRYDLARQALFNLLVYAGCRVSEALAVRGEHVDADMGTITIRTLKRRRPVFRVIPLPVSVVEMLLVLAARSPNRLWPVHRATAWRWVKEVMHEAGIAGPMASPKGLRHAFGSRAVLKGLSAPTIQRWMGHASLSTTAIYLDIVGDEERQLASRMW